jgi:DNA polymerase/3'-5' exonuclease PolX
MKSKKSKKDKIKINSVESLEDITEQVIECVQEELESNEFTQPGDYSEKEIKTTLSQIWEKGLQDNLEMAKLFDKLKEDNKILDQVYQARSYEKASNILRDVRVPILSGAQAQEYVGIGKSIGEKIDQYLETGTIKQIEKNQEKVALSKLFRGIWDVGANKAGEYIKRGYTSIYDIPEDELTKTQKISIQYYDDLQERIPRKEITAFENVLRNLLNKIDSNIRMEIAGSYRRELPTSGDIDVLMTYDKSPIPFAIFKRILRKLNTEGLVLANLKEGSGIYNGIIKINGKARRLDIHFVPKKIWDSSLLYFTGSQLFNIQMRQIAIDKGLKLSNKGLFDISGGKEVLLPFTTEEEIFEALDLSYVEPKDRASLKPTK